MRLPLVIQDKIFVGPDISQKDPLGAKSTCKTLHRIRQPLVRPYLRTKSARWHRPLGFGAGRACPSRIHRASPSSSATPCWSTVRPSRRPPSRPGATVCGSSMPATLGSSTCSSILPMTARKGSRWIMTASRPTQPFVNAATGDASWLQIGTEGGFLSKPAKVPSNVPIPSHRPGSGGRLRLDPSQIHKSLVVAPAERPDVIVDFSSVMPGKSDPLQRRTRPFPFGRCPQ